MTNQTSTIHELVAARDAERFAVARSYDDVPTYRKRWFSAVLFFVFIPAMIAIVLTGPVFQNDGGRALRWSDKQRHQVAIAGAVFMVLGLVRLLAMPA